MAETRIKTEADALRDILAWSSDRPIWQRDALRRLLTHGEITETDIDELVALCKDEALSNEPLSPHHISAQQTGAPTIALKYIRDIQGVNALAEGQTLTFIRTGVTIIYGDNGAGKSGYVRILKRACRARTLRGKEEEILTNIYDEQTSPQRAELYYDAGGQAQKTIWENGKPTDDLLSEVSVFDSRTANVHVDQTNDLAYTPYPMKLLERLVNACKSVKGKIDTEILSIKAQTPKSISNPNCSPETETGKLVGSLGANTKKETVIALTTLSEAEVSRLAKLVSDFTLDPKVTAKRLRAQRARLEKLLSNLEALSLAISPENFQRLTKLETDLTEKKAVATLAARDLSKDEPLDGVGSETWRRLWEAAREYSTIEAYRDLDFPNTDEHARCVLCQQELDPDAVARLRRFDAFVKDRTQRDENTAQQALDQLKHDLAGKALTRVDLIEGRAFLDSELGYSELASAVQLFVVRAHWRLRAMLKSGVEVRPEIPVFVEADLVNAINDLETRAEALLADDENEERKKLRAELEELKDRQWLAGIKDDVLAEITRLESITKLELALKDTKQSAITSKNTSLSEALITERLRARFVQEIDHLNLAGLAIELKQSGSKDGVSRFKISLMRSASHNAGEILSEGEYRCVALAGFMAELATNDSGSGIIFDDPVSSLDHLHREVIASRLAEEGRKRQVIVFTHDLPFLFLLRNACAQVDDPALKTEIALRHIQKRNDIPGYTRNEAPNKARNAVARVATMRTHLNNTRIQYDQDPDGINWLITARGLIDSLRQTWEAAVEDAISPVLRTFSHKVDTKGFIKLSAITQKDAETMRKHYGQCSSFLHNASDAMNPTVPKPESIEKELEALESWLSAVMDRQSKIAIR